MLKQLSIVLAVALLAGVAVADSRDLTPVNVFDQSTGLWTEDPAEFIADKDTYLVNEDPGTTNANVGGGCTRGFKFTQFHYFADWADADLEALQNTYWRLIGEGHSMATYDTTTDTILGDGDFIIMAKFGADIVRTYEWNAENPGPESAVSSATAIDFRVRGIRGGTDSKNWVEGTGDSNVYDQSDTDGATYNHADGTPANLVAWDDPSEADMTNFWQLSENNGSEMLVDGYHWQVSEDADGDGAPEEVYWNAVPFTQGLFNGTINDPDFIGLTLRTGSWIPDPDEYETINHPENARVLSNEQWGTNGGRLGIYWLTATGGDPGDADGDGDVDAEDLATLGLNWCPSCSDKTFEQGDFDGDGDVDAEDLAALGLNWNPSGAVPEPASMSLLALGGLALIRRKK